MAFLWRIIFAVFIFCAIVSKHETEASTRWQPSIIWDRFNPLLTCKCNWMNIPELAIYDRVQLVCPKSYLVSAFRKKDMAKREVFYNIFRRKYNYSNDKELNGLREMLDNGSFCNTTLNETKKLYTCRRDDINNKEIYESHRLRFHSDEDLNAGEIVVFFSNKKTGLERDLASKEKKCAMVFVVNVTAVPTANSRYDMSYGKCFVRDEDCKDPCWQCNANNIKCVSRAKYINRTEYINHTKPISNPCAGALKKSDDKIDTISFFAGFGTATVIIFLLDVVVYVIVVKRKGKLTFVKGSQALEARMEKQTSESGYVIPNIPPLCDDGTSPSVDAEEHAYEIPNNPCSRNGTLPSVDGQEDAYEIPNSPGSRNGRLPSFDEEQDRNAENKIHACENVARTEAE